jgi:HK97 family phage portal protein
MVIQSLGALQSVAGPEPSWTGTSGGSLNLYGSSQTYQAIYRSQPNVRTVIDFLARNVAQLGLHIFRRVSDTDRERLSTHELAGWLYHPNPGTTRYRLFEALLIDLGIYFNAFWAKVRSEPLGLVRLPPDQVQIEGVLLPSAYVWTPASGSPQRFAPSEIVHFSGGNEIAGLSPLETLRRILAEESAAGDYRQSMWNNSARIEGLIERPPTAPIWTPAQRQSWREQWQSMYARGGALPGSVAVLEDGMTFKPISHTAKDLEFLAARKLTREECAAAYHVPLPMVGILEHATFSNVREQHKHLYQDCLGPWLEMIEEEIERQLLIECIDQRDVYCEFNIQDKLKGSFEEQATSLQQLVGRPMMTANEGRARLNLPRDPDPASDKLAPQQGGPATAKQPPGVTNDNAGGASQDNAPAGNEDAAAMLVAPVLQAHRARQRARLSKVPTTERAVAFWGHLDRWTSELVADLTPLVGSDRALGVADKANAETLTQLETEALHA